MSYQVLETIHERTHYWLVFEGTDLLYKANTPLEALEWIIQKGEMPAQMKIYT